MGVGVQGRVTVALLLMFLSSCTGQSVDSGRSVRKVDHEDEIVMRRLANGDLTSIERSSISLSPGVDLDVSADGSRVLQTKEIRERTGISRDVELAVVVVETGERSVLRRAGPREDVGLAAWSPDGAHVAYRLTTYSVDPARVHPGLHPRSETLCVIELESSSDRCFSNVRAVFSFDWSPDGGRLVVAGDGKDPVRTIDVATGLTVDVLPRGGSDSIRRSLSRAGFGTTMEVSSPVWAPSGRLIAALVSVRGGRVPIIFGLDGRFVAMGEPSTESSLIAWSPTDDVLAYTTSKAPYETTGAFILPPDTGRSEMLMRFADGGLANELLWSPNGRWLSVVWTADSYAVFRVRA